MKTIANIALAAATVLGGSAVLAGPSLAQTGPVSLSANVAIVSDYRFRGLSLSDKDPAIQGGIDAGMGNFYAGVWGSSIEQVGDAETEIDLYGGYGGNISDGLSYDLGFLYYAYPDGNGSDYYELYGSVSGSVQLLDWTIGGAYAPDSSNLAEDNIYLYGDGHVGIPDSPVYVGAHVGWEDGAFSDPGGLDRSKVDWSGSLGVTYQVWDFSVSYVDSNRGDAGAVVSVGASF